MKWTTKDGAPVVWPASPEVRPWPGPGAAEDGAVYAYGGDVYLCRRGRSGGLWHDNRGNRILHPARICLSYPLSVPGSIGNRRGDSPLAWYLIPQSESA